MHFIPPRILAKLTHPLVCRITDSGVPTLNAQYSSVWSSNATISRLHFLGREIMFTQIVVFSCLVPSFSVRVGFRNFWYYPKQFVFLVRGCVCYMFFLQMSIRVRRYDCDICKRYWVLTLGLDFSIWSGESG